MSLARFVLSGIAAVATAHALAAGPGAPNPAPAQAAPHGVGPHLVKCAPTANIWVEPDVSRIPAYDLAGTEPGKKVILHLVGSGLYHGDSVLCSYATRDREVGTSFSLRCLDPRTDRACRHAYWCS